MEILSLFPDTYFPSLPASKICHMTHFWPMRGRGKSTEIGRLLGNITPPHDEWRALFIIYFIFSRLLLGSVAIILWPTERGLKKCRPVRMAEKDRKSLVSQSDCRNKLGVDYFHTINMIFCALQQNTTYASPLTSRALKNIYIVKSLFTFMIMSL